MSDDPGLAAAGPLWPADLAEAASRLDAVLRASPLLPSLGGELVRWGPGWAVTQLTPRPEHANLAGSVHGGLVAVLADAAFEAACNSYGRRCVAIELSVHYLAAAGVGAPLVATATEVQRSRRIGSYRIVVATPGAEGAVATFQALAFRTEDWHLGEASYPERWRRLH